VEISFSIHFLAENFGTKYPYRSNIYSCDKSTAPTRKDTTVKYVGWMETEREVASAGSAQGADGLTYRDLRYVVQMMVIGTAVEFSTVFGDGKSTRTTIDIGLEKQ